MAFMGFDVYEALFLMNENFHKAVLHLEALGEHEGFDRNSVARHLCSIKRVRSEANAYLMATIQQAETGVAR